MGSGASQAATTMTPSHEISAEGLEPQCPDCGTVSRWAGSPADSGFLAYCPSCDKAFHFTVTALRLP